MAAARIGFPLAFLIARFSRLAWLIDPSSEITEGIRSAARRDCRYVAAGHHLHSLDRHDPRCARAQVQILAGRVVARSDRYVHRIRGAGVLNHEVMAPLDPADVVGPDDLSRRRSDAAALGAYGECARR